MDNSLHETKVGVLYCEWKGFLLLTGLYVSKMLCSPKVQQSCVTALGERSGRRQPNVNRNVKNNMVLRRVAAAGNQENVPLLCLRTSSGALHIPGSPARNTPCPCCEIEHLEYVSFIPCQHRCPEAKDACMADH
jgi:hypothetical protein